MSAVARYGLPLALALAVACAFYPALSADFVSFDDPDNLVHNRAWRGEGALAWIASASHMGHYHPLTWLSFALDLRLGGLDSASAELVPAAFHRTNVALHALTAIAVFWAARRLLELSSELRGRSLELGALAAALAFALHPLRVESVAWVTERRDVLSGLFFVLATGAWLGYAPRARAFAAGSTSPLAALASSAAAAALVFLAIDFGAARLAVRGPLGIAGLVLGAALFAAGLAAAARVAGADRAARARLYMAFALLALAATSFAACDDGSSDAANEDPPEELRDLIDEYDHGEFRAEYSVSAPAAE